jgi:ribose transport system ATP-binding protein
VSFDLHRGEILGIYGLMGAGQADIAKALFGLEPFSAGELFVEGKPMVGHNAAAAIEAGMGLISRDRRQSLVPMLPMGPNISLAWLSRRSPVSRLEKKRESVESARYIEDMKIRPPSLLQKLLYFSGGNQQKVVLARWMSSGARILIFDEPTRGIDVAAKADVFALMTRLAEQGAAIMMISSEINELIGMADRVLIIQGGRLARELPRGELTEESLLMHAS